MGCIRLHARHGRAAAGAALSPFTLQCRAAAASRPRPASCSPKRLSHHSLDHTLTSDTAPRSNMTHHTTFLLVWSRHTAYAGRLVSALGGGGREQGEVSQLGGTTAGVGTHLQGSRCVPRRPARQPTNCAIGPASAAAGDPLTHIIGTGHQQLPLAGRSRHPPLAATPQRTAPAWSGGAWGAGGGRRRGAPRQRVQQPAAASYPQQRDPRPAHAPVATCRYSCGTALAAPAAHRAVAHDCEVAAVQQPLDHLGVGYHLPLAVHVWQYKCGGVGEGPGVMWQRVRKHSPRPRPAAPAAVLAARARRVPRGRGARRRRGPPARRPPLAACCGAPRGGKHQTQYLRGLNTSSLEVNTLN